SATNFRRLMRASFLHRLQASRGYHTQGRRRLCITAKFVGHVSDGSWLCENALAEALTTRDFGAVAVFGHVAVFGGLLCLERLLMRLQPSLSGSAAGYGHMSATTMPASPPAAVGRP